MTLGAYLAESAALNHATLDADSQSRMGAAIGTIPSALRQGNLLPVCGNGGSAADAVRLTGELVGRFLCERRAFKAYCLLGDRSVLTSCSNDAGFASELSIRRPFRSHPACSAGAHLRVSLPLREDRSVQGGDIHMKASSPLHITADPCPASAAGMMNPHRSSMRDFGRAGKPA